MNDERSGGKVTPEQVRDLANAIALQAGAIADGTNTGPVFGIACLLVENAKTLQAWTRDDPQYG